MIQITPNITHIETNPENEKYLNYIQEHRDNVAKAFESLLKINKNLLDACLAGTSIEELRRMVQEHDLSKYSAEEFQPYRINYFPKNEDEKKNNKEAYDRAWKHHYTVNDHHWQHWLDENGELYPIWNFNFYNVKTAYVHMALDWQAMGYKFGDTALKYYNSHKNEMKIYSELEDLIIEVMEELERVDGNS